MATEAGQAAYQCDITYVTGQELCFNYLRDNTALTGSELVGFREGSGGVGEGLVKGARTIRMGPGDISACARETAAGAGVLEHIDHI
jgi:hypothetical protein